jgi:hypothetical protein
VDIVGSFQTGYHISGIAPFGDLLVVLAYIPDEDEKEKTFSTSVTSRQVIIIPLNICYICIVYHIPLLLK